MSIFEKLGDMVESATEQATAFSPVLELAKSLKSEQGSAAAQKFLQVLSEMLTDFTTRKETPGMDDLMKLWGVVSELKDLGEGKFLGQLADVLNLLKDKFVQK